MPWGNNRLTSVSYVFCKGYSVALIFPQRLYLFHFPTNFRTDPKESDIEEYFKEQFKFIQTGQIKIERVLIVKTTSALKEFTSFVAKQLNGGVDFYVLSKDFADCRSINNADWNSGFNRDFALIGSEEKARYIIERKILENEIKGYEIKEIVGYSPFYVENIVNKRKPVRNFIQYFGDGQYNPIEDFFKKDTIN
jgi:hypothetical protein